jgi:hypothetical protein
MARALVKEGVFQGCPDNATLELVRLDDERDARVKALIYETGLDVIGDRDDKLEDIAGEALRAVQHYPVRTVSDLIAKMEIEESEFEESVSLDIILSDLRRIASQTA